MAITFSTSDEVLLALRDDPRRSDELLLAPLSRLTDDEITKRFERDGQPLVRADAGWADAF
jgi:hypothetical protein